MRHFDVIEGTKIAVADGRNAIPIEQLVKEDEPSLIYSIDGKKHLRIDKIEAISLTTEQIDIFKISLDDDSTIICSGNQQILGRHRSYISIQDLKKGDSLLIRKKWQTNLKEILGENKKSQNYWMLNTGKRNQFEHRFFFEQLNNMKIQKGMIIHHKDRNALNNQMNNLELMTKEEHDAHHDISGDNNPMRKWLQSLTEEEREKHRKNLSEAMSGEKNSRYSGFTNDEIFQRMLARIKDTELPLSINSWIRYAKQENLPQSFSKFRGSMLELVRTANTSSRFNNFDNVGEMKQYRQFLKLKKKSDLNMVFEDNSIRIVINCNLCEKSFKVPYGKRERKYCSKQCMLIVNKGKGALTNKKIAIEQRKIVKAKIFDLLEQYICVHKTVPPASTFFALLKENQISDLRTAGIYKGYGYILGFLTEKFIVESINVKKLIYNTKNYNRKMALKLIRNGLVYNHKVISIKHIGQRQGYVVTTKRYHNVGIVLPEKTTHSGKPMLEFVFTKTG